MNQETAIESPLKGVLYNNEKNSDESMGTLQIDSSVTSPLTPTNVKSFTLSKSSVYLHKGKGTKVPVKTYKLENTKKKELSDRHAAKFRYRSTNSKIAKVDKDGMITAVKEGKCTVFVYTRNGLSRKIVVTVTK